MTDSHWKKIADDVQVVFEENRIDAALTDASAFSGVTHAVLDPWDRLVEKWDNFYLAGRLDAGECGVVALYTMDYNTYFFVSEDIGTEPDARVMTGITHQQALALLVDWWDKENAHWNAVHAEMLETWPVSGRHLRQEVNA